MLCCWQTLQVYNDIKTYINRLTDTSGLLQDCLLDNGVLGSPGDSLQLDATLGNYKTPDKLALSLMKFQALGFLPASSDASISSRSSDTCHDTGLNHQGFCTRSITK